MRKIFITDISNKYCGKILNIYLGHPWWGAYLDVWCIENCYDFFWKDELINIEYIEITKENEDRFKKLIPFI